MSDQQTANSPQQQEPKLCKAGCGFFGNGATGDCCSKCWREMQKKQGKAVQPTGASAAPPAPIKTLSPIPEPMDFEPSPAESAQVAELDVTTTTTNSVSDETPAVTTAAAASASPKKKKKTSYKNMMANMMVQSNRDKEAEKEELRKVTGGGVFSKIDKI